MFLSKLKWLAYIGLQPKLNMQKYSINISLLSCHDYEVVNIILINKINKMNVELLCLNTVI
jgi:hypothetical protein